MGKQPQRKTRIDTINQYMAHIKIPKPKVPNTTHPDQITGCRHNNYRCETTARPIINTQLAAL